MPPRNVIWRLEPHTKGKHLVLKHYMDAWLPILTSWSGRVLFVDAFAGPGEYSNGEDGSPVIALRAFIDHRDRDRIRSQVDYLFIEKDEARFKHLKGVLGDLRGALPANCNYQVINSSFRETLTCFLDSVDQRTSLGPIFVMIDPFGVSDAPMQVIRRIFQNSRSEVYVSFMYREINRFRENPHFERHLDELFGCSEWRDGIDMPDGDERKKFFYDLYESQLKTNGAQYVVRFELYEGDQLVYAIFFGTKSLEGCDKMKQAVWKVDPIGGLEFRGIQLGQLTFGKDMIDFGLLEEALQNRFVSRGWQRIEDVENFVKSDATDFHSGHLRRSTLSPMERAGKIDVRRAPGKPRGSFTPGTLLMFRQPTMPL